jgi:hypothetical protein
VIDITPGSREVPLWDADTHPKVLYYREAVIVAPDVRIIPCHARFSKQQYTLRSVRCRDRTCPDETDQNDTDIRMMSAFRK